ncbi:hypothetical protein FQA39_LY17475 [Lamprigera yunnana]|nr:hypothetical protein FQA39_LY17475 [Lamprigera yunnana]
MKITTIVKKFADTAGVAKSTVYHTMKEHRETGAVTLCTSSGGRPHVVAMYDETTKKCVQQIIYNFFHNKELPTLDKILKEVQNRLIEFQKALFAILKTSKIKSEVKSNPRIPIVDGPDVDDQKLAYLEVQIDQAKLTITGATVLGLFHAEVLALNDMLIGQMQFDQSPKKMFGPLLLKPFSSAVIDKETQCLMCTTTFNLKLCLPMFLRHVFDVHHVVIEDAQHIDNLPGYISYWRTKFEQIPIEQIVPAVVLTPSDSVYFVLSTLLKSDKELRHKLRLETMLTIQEFERTDCTFKMSCLFCNLNFEGKRGDYVIHLLHLHNLRLGNPQNLVYMDELLQRIEDNLKQLKCIYCEKIFTDRTVLKDHMRKKQHKRINPSNCSYDKYYATNYLSIARQRSTSNKVDDIEHGTSCLGENSEEEYGDWCEGEDSITCLFCSHDDVSITNLSVHMSSCHKFNFYELCKHLDFYQKVKLVNYIRRQVHYLQCIYCDASFQNEVFLNEHMIKLQHCQLPEIKTFDQPEFYFPTFENDSFLHYLDDIDE